MTSPEVAIHGVLRDYDWGMVDGLQRWSGTATGAPQAELWFGGHPSAPSPTVVNPERTLLDEWAPASAPILTKLLAAATPLSLQVHPTAAQIATWWTDPESSALLSDRVEKTEMLIALEPFTVLLGWRPIRPTVAFLAAAGADQRVLTVLADGDRVGAVRLLLSDLPLRATRQRWQEAAAAAELDHIAASAYAAICERFGDDPGVAVAALLNTDLLAAGDAAYVPAGVPHAYVHGLGVEVMNSSDNVLRLGLTSKTVSVEHSLTALDADRKPLVIRRPADGRFAPPGAPFAARLLSGQTMRADGGSYRLVLCLAGETVIDLSDRRTTIDQGQALAIPADCPPARVASGESAVVVWVTREAG